MRAALVLPILVALAACSPGDQHEATNHIKSTASNLGGTIKEGTNSPYGAELKSDLKDLAKDTGKALKEGAKDTKNALDENVEEQRAPDKRRP